MSFSLAHLTAAGGSCLSTASQGLACVFSLVPVALVYVLGEGMDDSGDSSL